MFQDEMKYHIYNYEDFPVFLLLFAPYIVIGLHFFIRLFRTTESWNRLMYLIIFVGAGTILPQMILKVDYGKIYVLYILLLYSCCHGALCDGGYSNSVYSWRTRNVQLKSGRVFHWCFWSSGFSDTVLRCDYLRTGSLACTANFSSVMWSYGHSADNETVKS